jgi:acetyltransferase-like isoleucine patch superfamily enzyme
VTSVRKVHEGSPHGVDLIVNGEVQLLVNTPVGKHAQQDDERLRMAAIANRVPYTTTLSAASAAVAAIAARREQEPAVRSLQEWHLLLGRGRRHEFRRRRRRRGGRVSVPAGMVDAAGAGRVAAGVRLGAGALVHESAYVDDGAEIGNGTRIWHFCHVMGGARIGAGCSLGQNVVVMRGVRVGDNCKIQNNVSLYEGVVLEDDVFCGPSMVFTNVLNPRSAVLAEGRVPAHPGAPRRDDRGQRHRWCAA